MSAKTQSNRHAKFEYNKDSDQWVCAAGEVTVHKYKYNGEKRMRGTTYKFDAKVALRAERRKVVALK